MCFADPVAAFTNIGRALRPGARLVLLVWQERDRNEWATAIRRSLTATSAASQGLDAFSLAAPAVTEGILAAAGFTDVGFTDVHEPVYYGQDGPAAPIQHDPRPVVRQRPVLDVASAVFAAEFDRPSNRSYRSSASSKGFRGRADLPCAVQLRRKARLVQPSASAFRDRRRSARRTQGQLLRSTSSNRRPDPTRRASTDPGAVQCVQVGGAAGGGFSLSRSLSEWLPTGPVTNSRPTEPFC